jgi:hypothetical protein
MAQLEAEPDGRSPARKRFTRRPVNTMQLGFLPEVNKTAFAPMRGASFRNEAGEEATSDLEYAAAEPTCRPPFLGAWTSRPPSDANGLTALEGAAARLGVRPSWWSPAPLSPFGPPSPLSPLARAIKPLTRSIPWRKSGPQPAPLAGGSSPGTTLPQPEGTTSEAPLSPLARALRPLVARGGQTQGQAVTEHATPRDASLPGTQQPQQLRPPPQMQQAQAQMQQAQAQMQQAQAQMQQAQAQQAAVPASAAAVPTVPAVSAEPAAVPAAVPAAAAGPSRGRQSGGRQSTFVTDEVETVGLTYATEG